MDDVESVAVGRPDEFDQSCVVRQEPMDVQQSRGWDAALPEFDPDIPVRFWSGLEGPPGRLLEVGFVDDDHHRSVDRIPRYRDHATLQSLCRIVPNDALQLVECLVPGFVRLPPQE